jgi:hypothetical protein
MVLPMIIAIGVISRELVQCGSIQYLRVAGDHLIMGSPLSIWEFLFFYRFVLPPPNFLSQWYAFGVAIKS